MSEKLSRPPTTQELQDKVMSYDHSSQGQFEGTRNGKMFPTCVQNGYTFTGYPNGMTPPNYLKFRMEARLKEMEKELRKSKETIEST